MKTISEHLLMPGASQAYQDAREALYAAERSLLQQIDPSLRVAILSGMHGVRVPQFSVDL